jgi:hypothetical protein
MAKKVDYAKAKAARQKKIAIVLGIVFLAVVGFQGPRTLKMLKGPGADPVAAPVTTTPTATPAPEAAVPPLGAPATAPSVGAPAPAQPAVLASSDVPPSAGAGQLVSFERFESKDPFVQQVDSTPSVVSGATGSGASKKKPDADSDSAPPAATSGKSAVPGSGEDAPPAEPAPAPAAATTIKVNGLTEPVTEGKTFPVADPIFVFVSAALDGKSVKIGIAGGEYADGKDTIKLVLGKPLTLQNTADGSRYELVLETVAGFVPPKSKK